MRHESKSFVLGMILLVLMMLAGCDGSTVYNGDRDSAETGDQLLIYTSMYPLYFFTKEIVGDRGEVVNLIPAGMDPHDFEPTIHDMMRLSKADLFVYNGSGLEPWIERMTEVVDKPGFLLDTTEAIHLASHDHERKMDHHEHDLELDGEDHVHHPSDPHVWLDPHLAKLQAEAIKDGLIHVDQKNEPYYRNNFKQLAERLDQLDAQFQDLAKHAQRTDFVVSHAAFGHLANRYGLNQVAITGVHVEEPSSRQVQEIIRFILDNGIEYILIDHLSTSKVAEVIKAETGVNFLMLHHLEGLTEEEAAQGKDYFSIMEENLNVLKKALGYEAS